MRDWFQSKGYELNTVKLFESEDLPSIKEIDFLVILGGPMGACEEDKYKYLTKEKLLIQRLSLTKVPILGICLGAQLIASALGAKVYQHTQKEIGWFKIKGNLSADANLFTFPETATVFQWHSDTFDLPPKATLIAESEACRNQAFQIGKSILGLQFHLEFSQKTIEQLIEHFGEQISDAPYIQKPAQIQAAEINTLKGAQSLLAKVLEYLHASRLTS